MGTIATLYVELYESSEERLVGGSFLKMSAITALSMRTVSCIMKRKNYDHSKVLRGNCFICRARWQESVCLFQRIGVGLPLPQALLPEIEAENPEFTFILIDRDASIWIWRKSGMSMGSQV